MKKDLPLFILLTSGPIAVGKSQVVDELIKTYGFSKISSGGYLSKLAQRQNKLISRANLTSIGDSLDKKTNYAWVVEDVAKPIITSSPNHRKWIFDSVRKKRQVEHFKSKFPNSVFHLHLEATEDILETRYSNRQKSGDLRDAEVPYKVAIDNPNEKESRNLISIADLVLNNSQTNPDEVASKIHEVYEQW